jgi:hypothetical protein
MPTFNHIGGAEPSTLTFKLATVSQTRNSSVMHQEIMALGDPDTSNAIAAILNTAPASTAWALATRPVGIQTVQGNSTVFQGGSPWTIAGNSTVAPLAGSTWNTRPVQSSAADLQMTATQGGTWNITTVTAVSSVGGIVQIQGNSTAVIQGNSTAFQGGSWTVTVQGNSTVAPLAGSTWATRPIQSSAADLQMTATPAAGSTWNVRALNSSAADLQATVTPVAGSTWATRPIQSSAADLQMTATPLAGSTWNTRTFCSSRADFLATVYQSSASEFLVTATLGTNLQSSVAPSSGSSGLVVRQVVDAILTTSSTDAFGVGSTAFVIQSSGAGLRSYVTAYSILTTNAGPTKVAFFSSATMLWPVLLAAVSSAVSGVNLAVSAPAYLFRTQSAEALTLRTKGSSIAGWHVGVSYFRAP